MDFCLKWSRFILKAVTWLLMPQAVGIDQKLVIKTWNYTPGIILGITLQTVWSVGLVSVILNHHRFIMVFSSSGFITSSSNKKSVLTRLPLETWLKESEEQSSIRTSLYHCVDYRECLCFNAYKVVWLAKCMVIFLCSKCGPWNSKWDDCSVVYCTLTSTYHEVVLFLGKLPN